METQWLPVSLVCLDHRLGRDARRPPAGAVRRTLHRAALCPRPPHRRQLGLAPVARGRLQARSRPSGASDARPWRSPGSCSASSLSGSRAMGRARRWSSPSTTRPPSGTGPACSGRGKHPHPTPGPAGSPFVLDGHVWVCLARLVRDSPWGAIALPILSGICTSEPKMSAGWRPTTAGSSTPSWSWPPPRSSGWSSSWGPDHPPIWVVSGWPKIT